ncbi:alcohol dehydrogenase [Thioalkalivibrio nitratireducens DSM 14787]|uniref:Alcohol dehydrogenase n=1 Tax=Thioalkalivibrio nitratireducens (strain DSM 14787 / UNIQEM 213 / ALEN2) TaxID=1255043 RepID=L0DTF2_THIND|nr:SDR family NAD(P)-dependent oxidoreductase [Thioalkalivibrio nitratireducens]AGA32277.1 alcohol dehydrogenase [Thioalkalivibrio nitratireducens DSM 14787]
MQETGSESIRTALITGNSSGLGLGLTRVLKRGGTAVYGLSRRGCPEPVAGDVRVDLAEHDRIAPALGRLLEGVERLDLVVLNAGILGQIQRMQDADLAELKHVMDVNVWANKPILDELLRREIPVGQIVAISSGAAVFGSHGWSGYALSKAALNMLVQLYAHEFPDTPVHSLAPGLVDTAMQEYLCEDADVGAFPGLERLREARGTADMPDSEAAAQQVLESLTALRAEPSGRFLDLRALRDPDAYQRLLASKATGR